MLNKSCALDEKQHSLLGGCSEIAPRCLSTTSLKLGDPGALDFESLRIEE